MKTVIVYYSLEGDTKLVAEMIAQEMKADLVELKLEKEIPTKGFKKYFLGGRSVIRKETPRLINEMPNFNNYDLVIIGTPVWVGSFASPIHTFLKENDLSHKEVAFFACHGGGGTEKCFAQMKEALANSEVKGMLDIMQPKEKKLEPLKEIVQEWVTTLR